MRRDLFAALPTTTRLWCAAVFAVIVPTADQLNQTFGTLIPGYTIAGDCGYADGYCTPDTYVPGTYLPGSITYTSHAQLRILVWVAVVCLVIAASRPRTLRTLRVARLAALALAGALAAGLAEKSSLVCLALVVALLLVGPLVARPGRPRRPVLAPAQFGR